MPSASAEQSELRRRGRHRLIGAVTLALVAAVVIPMVLDGEPKRAPPPLELAIPARDVVAPAPAPDPAPPAPNAGTSAPSGAVATPEAAAPVAAVAETPKPAADAGKARVATVTEAATAPAAPPAAKPPAADKAEKTVPALVGFAVQAGAFREEAKLSQAKKKLVAAGLSHYSERIAGTSGEITRLRAGPFPTREAAAAAAAKMKAAGLDAAVVPLP